MAPDMSDIDDRTVWVGNLDSRVSEELIWELFLQAGPLESVKIPKDHKTGKLRNYAFVVFQHQISVPYVMDLMNQIKLYDSVIRISLKNKSSNENAPSPNAAATQDQMRRFDQQDRYNTHSPILHHQAPAPSWQTMPPSLMMPQHPPQMLLPLDLYADAAYLPNMSEWRWEEPRMPHRRREELIHRSYSSPHQLHEESHRPHPYHHGRRYR